MGHFTNIKYYEVDTFSEAVAAFRRDQEHDREEYGYNGGPDSIQSADDPDNSGREFPSKRAADEWLNEHVHNYACIAVKVVGNKLKSDAPDDKKALEVKVGRGTAKERRNVEKARELLERRKKELEEAVGQSDERGVKVVEGKTHGETEGRAVFVTCRGCKSRINARFLIETYRGHDDKERKTYKVRACKVCGEENPYIAPRDSTRTAKAEEAVEAARGVLSAAEEALRTHTAEIRNEYVKKKGKPYVGWMIGCDVHH